MKQLLIGFLGFIFSTLYVNAFELSAPDNTGNKIVISEQKKEYYPLALKLITEKKEELIDEYDVNGGDPVLVAADFVKIDGKNYFITLISWRIYHYDIKGTQYQSYVYSYENEQLQKNNLFFNDQNLEGFSGHSNFRGETEYSLDDLENVKGYLKTKLRIPLIGKIKINKAYLYDATFNQKKSYLIKNDEVVLKDILKEREQLWFKVEYKSKLVGYLPYEVVNVKYE